MTIKCPNCGRPVRSGVLLCDCGHSVISELEEDQKDIQEEVKPEIRKAESSRNIVSLAFSIFTIIICTVIGISGSGTGMTNALHAVFLEIIIGGLGLSLAFAFGCFALVRGEQPMLLSLVAFAMPPLIILFLVLCHSWM